MDLIKIAVRNIFRNKRRSFLTSLSLFVAGFVIVTLHGYVTGMLNASKEMIINLDTGHVLITTKEYFERRTFIPVEEFIYDTKEIENTLKSSKYVDFYTLRVKAPAMLFTKSGVPKMFWLWVLILKKRKNLSELARKI